MFRYLRRAGYDVFWYGKNDALAAECFYDSVTEWNYPHLHVYGAGGVGGVDRNKVPLTDKMTTYLVSAMAARTRRRQRNKAGSSKRPSHELPYLPRVDTIPMNCNALKGSPNHAIFITPTCDCTLISRKPFLDPR